jgi:hypothetical protein
MPRMPSNRPSAACLRTLAIATVRAVGLGSCATIVKGKKEKVEFRSNPVGASVRVVDSEGNIAMQGVTPCSAELRRGTGGWFKKEHYTVVYELDGYAVHERALAGSANNWFIFGNLVFGGLIGWLIVDPWTGAMYTMSKDPFEIDLTETTPGT